MAVKMLAAIAFIAVCGIVCANRYGDDVVHGKVWALPVVSGHLPDLRFNLTSDEGRTVTAADYHGDVVLLFFGFTSCPDECPATMTRLTRVLRQLGNDAANMRVVFVSVDPGTDTPNVLHDYMANFDTAHMVGLTGDDGKIRALAQRYRASYRPRKPGGDEDDIVHAAAIYIFDKDGRARLLAMPEDSDENLLHDLRQLAASGGKS